MSALEPGAAFLIGLLGSGHCVAMCGGIATALEVAAAPGEGRRATIRVGYQAGRLGGYAVAGALAGGLGTGLFTLASRATALAVSHWLTASMLLLLGLYLSGAWRAPLSALERGGMRVWNTLAPIRKRLLPVRGVGGAVRMGLLWGFLPCGLVYSALALALASGEVRTGALTMLAFGAGTVPAVVLVSGAAGRVLRMPAGNVLRTAAGVAMIAAGIAMGINAAQH
jgi:sulfite exporter TauE/SafE